MKKKKAKKVKVKLLSEQSLVTPVVPIFQAKEFVEQIKPIKRVYSEIEKQQIKDSNMDEYNRLFGKD